MKLFGNSKKKKKSTSSGKTAAVKETNTKSAAASEERNVGLIGALARPGINKAKDAIDTEEHRRRTPEERKRIEEDIERYQRKKVTTRLVVGIVIVLLIVAAFVAYKMTVVPPDINPDPTPGVNDNQPENSPGADENPDVSPTPSRTPIENVRQDGMYTFLVVGNDQGNGNTDTLIVGRFDTVNHKLNLISIPRDTMANVEWPVKKVNTIQAFGGNGIDSLVDGLSDILGFEVDSYISVNLKGFKALVQAIGGVYFDVPQDMKYVDPTQNLVIDVKEGYQLLTPEQAEGVVRFRSGYVAGDIKRIEVQQDFLMALAKQCLSMKNLTSNIDEYAEIFKTYVTTDLSIGNIVWYGQEMLKLSPDAISFDTLPANYNDSVKGLSYCTIYLDRWIAMINSSLNPYIGPIKAENLNVLTRDENGNLYSTSGAIAGGYESFYDNTVHIVPDDEEEEENNEEDVTPETTPEQSPEPTPEASPETTPEPAPEATPEPTPEPTPEATPEPSEEPAPEESESPWDDIEDDETPEPTEEVADPEPSEEPEESGSTISGSPGNLW